MSVKKLEFAVGLFVALGVTAFFMLALKVSDITALGDNHGYTISASFEDIGGLKVRAPVTLAGVRIGRVAAINIDKQSYEAVVKLAINSEYNQLPIDTGASILTSGIVGEQYVGLEPGGSEDYLKDGDIIKLTQPALVLERLIGRFLTSFSAENSQ